MEALKSVQRVNSKVSSFVRKQIESRVIDQDVELPSSKFRDSLGRILGAKPTVN